MECGNPDCGRDADFIVAYIATDDAVTTCLQCLFGLVFSIYESAGLVRPLDIDAMRKAQEN